MAKKQLGTTPANTIDATTKGYVDGGLSAKQSTSEKGQASGYASLDTNGKVPGAQLPNSIMTYQGLHNASTNSPALTDAGGAAGQVYRISVAGTRNYGAGNIELAVGDYLIHNGTAWEKADTTDAVSTVAGKTGNVTLVKADVGLTNVDDTSDATKNAATATLTNKTITNPKIGNIYDPTQSKPVLDIASQAGSVNRLAVVATTTGVAPYLITSGTDTNIDLNLRGQGTGIVQANGVPVVTTTGTQTLTNKTLTDPKINAIKDTLGNNGLSISAVTSGANHFQITGSAATGSTGYVALLGVGSDPNVTMQLAPKGAGQVEIYSPTGQTPTLYGNGADANHSLNLRSKGTGTVNANGVPLVTTTGSQTLTNKTISGSSNTITSLPASATPNAARLVRTTGSTVIGQWARVLTFAAPAAPYFRYHAMFSISCFARGGAIIDVDMGTLAADQVNGSVQILSRASSSLVGDDSFKIINNGYGQPFELWFKSAGGGSIAFFYEIGKISEQNVTFETTSTFTATKPVGTVLNVVSAGGVLADGVPVVTTTGSQTLTNKTLTSPTLTDPKIGTGPDSYIKDSSGNNMLYLGKPSASAVNYATISNAATGNWVKVGAWGDDTNVSLNLTTKGTGVVQANGVPVVTTTGTQTLTNKTINVSTPETLSVFNTPDETTNYERMRLWRTSNVFFLSSESGGTGTRRALTLQNGGGSLTVQPSSSTTGGVNITNNTGSPAASSLGITGTLGSSSGTQYSLQVAPVFTQTGTAGYAALLINPTETSTGSGTKRLIDAQVGGVSKFSVASTGDVAVGTSTSTSTATPASINLGGTYGNSTPGSANNLKVRVFDDGTYKSGIGFSASAMEYQIPTGNAHRFYVAGVETLAITGTTLRWAGVDIPTISSTSTLTNKTLTAPTINNAAALSVGTNSITATATPVMVGLGGTYGSNAAGNAGNVKLAIYNDGTTKYGLGISSQTMEYQAPSGASHRFYVAGTERFAVSGTDVTIGGVSAVTTTGTQSLTNKTLTAPTISNPTISGSLTVPNGNSLVSGSQTNVNIPANSTTAGWPSHTPFSQRNWHDHLRLGNWIPYPTQQVYNGTAWSSQTVTKNLFSGNEYSGYTLADGTTTTGVRWTWNSGNLAYGGIQWWMIGHGYTVPVQNNSVVIESSADGVTWTNLHTTASSTGGSANPVWYYANSNGGHTYVRLTIMTNVAQPILIHYIKALSLRTGAQGGGTETEYPYIWDADKNITSRANLIVGVPGTTAGSAVTIDATQTLTNKTLNSPTLTSPTTSSPRISDNTIKDSNGNTVLSFAATASAVNYINLWNRAAAGAAPVVEAVGSDTNVSLNLRGKGTGVVQINGAEAVTVSNTQTLTNKTLNSPTINTANIRDTLGNRVISIPTDGSPVSIGPLSRAALQVGSSSAPVNFIRMVGQDTGAAPYIQANGTDTNISLSLLTKGTGTVQANGVDVVTTTGTQALTNKTLTSPTITSPTVSGGASLAGSYTFTATGVSNDDWQNSPISLRERGQVALTQSGNEYSPNLNFHWASRVSNSLWMNSSGALNWGGYDAAGVPNANGTINAANIYATNFYGALTGNATSATSATNATYVGEGMPDNADSVMNFRVMRNENSSLKNDGMYIGWGNTNGGNTRIYGGGQTSNPVEVITGGALLVPGGITVGGVAVPTISSTSTLTNKTISGSSNTLSNISISSLSDAARLFNNMGDVHATRTAFDAAGGPLSVDFGWRYVQGNTNGPGTNSAAQYYSLVAGLGDGYSTYAMQVAFPRNVTNPYLSIRYEENNVLGAWQKISAGYADTAGSATTATSAATLTTARTIGGVSFNGSANINLPGVNTTGNQNTTGNAATATNATQVGGYAASTAATANTVAVRQANGYLLAVYYNNSHAVTTRNAETIFYTSNDDYIRKNTVAGAKTSLALNNVDNTSDATKNAATATLTNKTLSAPVLSGTVTGTYSFGGTPTWPTFNQNTTGSAATLTTGRTVQTNLASTAAATFNGSANITPGVTGTLPVANGGTGATTLTGLVKGNGTSAMTAAAAGTDYVAPGGALGTPSSGTLTNCTFPANIVSVTGTHAATLKSALVAADEFLLVDSEASWALKKTTWQAMLDILGPLFATVSMTFTNKRITSRIGTEASNATPTINCDLYDQYNITALAANITSVTVTGTPTDGQKLMVRIKGTAARTIAWGASFVASGVAPLLTTTVTTKTHLCSFLYDSAAAKWVAVATDDQGY